MKEPLSSIHEAIKNVLRDNPQGVTMAQARELVGVPPHEQLQFGRRLRELYPYFQIERKREGRNHLYIYIGPRGEVSYDRGVVSKAVRARIIFRDGSRCQMCGRTPVQDMVKLHVDHRVPRDWGGSSEESNLWTLCSECNEGKKNLFATFDAGEMQDLMQHRSVHARIAALLHRNLGAWVDSALIGMVANASSWQEDWHKRLRELRYLGLRIESRRTKVGNRSVSQYRLTNWVDLPDDPTAAARRYERDRAARNRRKSS